MDFKYLGHNLMHDTNYRHLGCKDCKCNTCAHINECEIITEKLEYIEKMGVRKCPHSPILECSGYSSDKDTTQYNSWECLIKNMIGGD